jgi:phospholipase/lecithinase/hemolysin
MRILLAALLSIGWSLSAVAAPFSGVYFFGDSLTDTGNVTAVYETVPKPPGAPAVIPGPPYDAGGRASNGLLYADVLAAGLGADASASARGGHNYAFGGARTRYQLFGPPFLGILDQVDAFRAQAGPADPAALYVVWGGSNNLQDIFLGRSTDPLGRPIPGLDATLNDMGRALSALYDEGARRLLVPNVPDLGLVPRVRELGGAAAQSFATSLVRTYNTGLASLLDGFEAAHPDSQLIRFDSFGTLDDIVAHGASHGFVNTTDRCYTGDDLGFTGGGTVCANPDDHVFWDGIHPTAAAHRLLGEAMLQAVVVAVPEPSTWAMMAAGLLALGGLAWRRPRQRAAATSCCSAAARRATVCAFR